MILCKKAEFDQRSNGRNKNRYSTYNGQQEGSRKNENQT